MVLQPGQEIEDHAHGSRQNNQVRSSDSMLQIFRAFVDGAGGQSPLQNFRAVRTDESSLEGVLFEREPHRPTDQADADNRNALEADVHVEDRKKKMNYEF